MNQLLWVLLAVEALSAILLAAGFAWLVKTFQSQTQSLQRISAEREAKLEEARERLRQSEASISQARTEVEARLAEAEALKREANDLVHQTAALTPERAKEIVVSRAEEAALPEAKLAAEAVIRNAEQTAKNTVLEVMERTAADYVSEASITVVQLPNDDMKGRLIGKEGRNIRSFEQITGTDLIIDETPEAVVISCFDPMRREIAAETLRALVKDGRIQPIRIEEEFAAAQIAIEKGITEAGRDAAERANITALPTSVIEAMGRLKFRTGYGQNVLDHSVETAHIAGMIASELGFSLESAKTAAFLHDIGKSLPVEWEGPHALTGMRFLEQNGLKEPVLGAVGAHHYDIPPGSPEAHIVIIADTISASRPGARRENLDNYTQRLKALEELADKFPGVERSYAVQAGRELRVIAKSNEVDDAGIDKLAKDLAAAIKQQMQIPGQVQVTVVRETRAEETTG